MKEIICEICGKKEIRKIAARYCISCSASRYYKPQIKKLILQCVECKENFNARAKSVKFCSSQCQTIRENRRINKAWVDRPAERSKFRKDAIKNYNTSVTPNMDLIDN